VTLGDCATGGAAPAGWAVTAVGSTGRGGTAPDDEIENEVYHSTGAPMEAWLGGFLGRLFALVPCLLPWGARALQVWMRLTDGALRLCTCTPV
jgi:hypothetical protein